jgi:hypothetical protein
VIGDEYEARQGKQASVGAFTGLGSEEQAADLGRPVMLGHQVQGADLLAHLEHLRFDDSRLDAVGVERFEAAHLGNDAGGTHHLPFLQVFHHEEVGLAPGLLGHARKSPLRLLDAPLE